MAKVTSVKVSADNNKLYTAEINNDDTRKFNEYDISLGIDNKSLSQTTDVTSFDDGIDVISLNSSGDNFIGIDRRGREINNLNTTTNFSINTLSLLGTVSLNFEYGFDQNFTSRLVSTHLLPFGVQLSPSMINYGRYTTINDRVIDTDSFGGVISTQQITASDFSNGVTSLNANGRIGIIFNNDGTKVIFIASDQGIELRFQVYTLGVPYDLSTKGTIFYESVWNNRTMTHLSRIEGDMYVMGISTVGATTTRTATVYDMSGLFNGTSGPIGSKLLYSNTGLLQVQTFPFLDSTALVSLRPDYSELYVSRVSRPEFRRHTVNDPNAAAFSYTADLDFNLGFDIVGFDILFNRNKIHLLKEVGSNLYYEVYDTI